MNVRAVVSIGLLAILPLGLLVPSLAAARHHAAQQASLDRLRGLAIGVHSHHDTHGYLPHNGGHTDPDKLKEINHGWHNPEVKHSGTWTTAILPYIELKSVYANNAIKAESVNDVPAHFKDREQFAKWANSLKPFKCIDRSRKWYREVTTAGNYPGPLTDYAINVFINSPPKEFGSGGTGFALNGGVAIAPQSRATIQGLPDGSSNTILLAIKAISPDTFQDPITVPWDEGIFSPGNYDADNDASSVTGTGTGRGHVVNAKVKQEDAKERPAGGGVPWIWLDRELTADPEKKTPIPDYAMDWGTPFPAGLPAAFSDGSVRFVSLKQRGTLNFAHMLYPNDGGNVALDD